jgi:peptidoglycan/LPS O-acetylase OafA/YrhL
LNESQPKAFRADIQGLRAIAVATVFLYHLWPESMTGGYVGVDVFFVVSGFLITNILKREMLASGRLSLPNFYIRRARRLLPAAAVVIIASGILTLSLFPVTRWNNLAGEMSASALYVQNIYLYFQSVDYLRQDLPPSLLRHYWSLSVEEQFYFIWPILMVLFAGVARRNRRAGEWALFAACSAVFVLSALSSAFMTADNPSGGYFLPQNRLFELALGGMLSLAFPYVTLRSWFARLLGWSGLGGILAAAFLFNHETVFPGTAALLPTLATALILLAGKNQEHTDWRSVGGILGLKPLTYLGDISYSLYLWHWPLVLSAFEIWGEDLNLTQGLMVIALSVALSHLTKYHVEDRWRYAHPESRGWLALTKFSVFRALHGLCAALRWRCAILHSQPGRVAARFR